MRSRVLLFTTYHFIDVLHGKPHYVFTFWAAFTRSQFFLEGFRKTIAAGKSTSFGVLVLGLCSISFCCDF
jgi:hypothetical protein